MIKDTTELFLQAFEERKSWQTGGFEDAINRVQENPHLSLNWDRSVPEFWAGIDIDERPVAVIRLDFPLIIVLNEYHETISQSLSNATTKYLLVNNFKSSLFSIDPSKIEQVFPDKFSDVIDYQSFNIQQLVYGTI